MYVNGIVATGCSHIKSDTKGKTHEVIDTYEYSSPFIGISSICVL